MPTYEYECQKCGKHFDYFQSMSEPKKTACEECGGALERLISASGFILKGGGWYKDLYSSTKKDTKSETKTETKSETKTETKSETKSSTPSTTKKE